jgi:hypothetical protein
MVSPRNLESEMAGPPKAKTSIWPMTAQDTVQKFPRFLYEFEKIEIFEYPTIYYINLLQERKE